MYNTNALFGVSGYVAEIPSPHKAIIQFELHQVLQTAFLTSHRFHKDGKRLSDNESLDQVIKIGHKVNFSCHINDNSDPSQCKWFVTNCWRQIETETKLIMSSGMMNVAGTITDLKQRHGTLLMIDLLGTEYRIHFLASKVYLYGKRLSSSKPLTSQLQVDDKVYFDAIPCFSEENNQNCNWFATCVHKGKKPDIFSYKDSPSKTSEAADLDREKILNQYVESIKSDDKSIRGDSPISHADNSIDELNKDVDSLSINAESSAAHPEQQQSGFNSWNTVLKQNKAFNDDVQTSEVSSISETELIKEDFNLRIEPNRINAQLLNDMKLLTNDPRVVFAKSEGIILNIINEEFGVILGEFQRNVFQSILFHRKNAFLFKMSLADSKLTEIFIEGDRVRFIAVDAPEKFICDWVATQVSVAYDKDEDDDDLSDDISED